jgi:hypothetical protein
MIAVHNITTPALAKGAVFDGPATDTYMRSKSDPLAARGRLANSVEVSCTPEKAVTLNVQISADWSSPEPSWTTLHSLKVAAGEDGRAVFNVEGWRWVRVSAENGSTEQGPVSIVTTWHEG